MANVTDEKDPIERRLVRAGRAHRRAGIRLAAARDEMYDAIRAARDGNLSLGVIAELAGVSKGLVQQVDKGADGE